MNPKLKALHSNFNVASDALYLNIACGKCAECQIRKQQDWITRLAYEYRWTLDHGGYALFETFTYREEEVPKLHGMMVFNKDHFKEFMKELRVRLVRHYEKMFEKEQFTDDLFNYPYLYDNTYEDIEKDIDENGLWNFNVVLNKKKPTKPEYYPVGKIKIFFVSEYGGEYKRPHYHAIIFVQYKIQPNTMLYYIKKSWKWGFIGAGGADKKIVNSMRGIAYVAKYVCKDIEFAKALTEQKNSNFRNYLEHKWQQIYNEPFDEETFNLYPCDVVKKILKEIDMDKALPFIRVSRHLGESAIETITKDMLKRDEMPVPDAKKGTILTQIPDYYKRKLMYDYDKNIKYWQLNNTGKIIKSIQIEQRMENVITTVENCFNYYIVNYAECNPEYYQKMYADIKKNKKSWQKLITCIYERNKMISQDIIRWIQADNTDLIQQERKNIMDTVYITAIQRNKPWHWILEEHIKLKECTVDHWLDMNKIKDERFKYLVQMYDIVLDRIRNQRCDFQQMKLEAEHKVKSYKY